MMIQTIIQIYRDDCEFIKEIHPRHLDYESLDEYQRKVIETKVKVQKKRLCEWKRWASLGPPPMFARSRMFLCST